MKTVLKTIQLSIVVIAVGVFSATPQLAAANNNSAFDLLNGGSLLGSISNPLDNLNAGGNFGSSVSQEIVQTTCNITVNQNNVDFGGSVTVSWEANGFNNITINGESVSSESGSMTVSNIVENRIFQLAAVNGGDVCAAQVLVTCNPPQVARCDDFYANPATIEEGDSSVLTWNTTNATNVSIDNGIGRVSGDGSITVSPDVTTTYKLTVTGAHNNSDSCTTKVTVNPAPVVPVCDFFDANPSAIQNGGSATLNWGTTNASRISINNGVGNVDADGSTTVSPNVTTTYTLSVFDANNHIVDDCATKVTVTQTPPPVVPVCDAFSVSPAHIERGGSAILTWETTDASRVGINNGVGNVSADGSTSVSPLTTTTYTLSVFDANNHIVDDCKTTVTVKVDEPAPVCDFFRANPATIVTGNSATLAWGTTHANTVRLNGSDVALDGTQVVSPTNTTSYTLTVIGAKDQVVDCSATVTVTNDPVPECVAFTATPSALPVGGGIVNFAWDVDNATNVSISPTIGSVSPDGNASLTVTQSTTYTLTAVDANGDTDSCIAPVAVADPAVFTCADNVSFSATDRSIRRGQDTTLNWNVTGADTVSISDLGTVSLTGSQSVSPRSDQTYTLTATQGNQTINCPVPINVSSGGGGGSPSPRCDLDISDRNITRGESITLRWDSSRANELEIVDDRGRVIVTTDGERGDDKDDLLDGSIRLTPTRDTEYTLTVERGSRDRECSVEVDVRDGQVLGEVRTQQPLVAGIALSQVPYTGFEAGPVLTLLFYVLLLAWALYIAYFLVIRKQDPKNSDTMFATANNANVNEVPAGTTHQGYENMKSAESARPDVFTTSANTETQSGVPANLPMADAPIGYESYFAGADVTESQADQVVTDLENRAHAQQTLLSSDAIELFMRATDGEVERNEMLDKIISDAKTQYPLEDGWIVINRTRMQSLCDECFTKENIADVQIGESLPEGSGSLAEAIVTGNVVAAYEMIGNRPMVALANAAADLDSVVRHRKGNSSPISDLLLSETESLSDEQLQTMITALTGAIDGTYTDEASAVKMAIMKAVKEVA